MPQRAVREAWSALWVLQKGSKRTFAALLNDPNLWKLIVRALIEIAYNFLYEDVGLSQTERKQLGKIDFFLHKLVARGGGKTTKTLRRKRGLILKNRKATLVLFASLFSESFKHLLE